MRVLLVHPTNGPNFVDTYSPHLGIGHLASSLRKAMPVEVAFAREHIDTWLKDFQPDVVGISSSSEVYGIAKRIARTVKQAGIPVIIGGRHISALPQTMTEDMDVAVLGEGEETFTELLKDYAESKTWHGVDGVAFQGLCMTPERKLIPDLDSLPFPARDILPINKWTSMMTSRGCPFSCRYCGAGFWGKPRFHSAAYVVEEMRHLQRQGVTRITFEDDLFVANFKRLVEIAELKRDLKMSFVCNVRSNLVTDYLCRLLRELGVDTVGIGIESGCQQTLDYLKGHVTVEQHVQAITLLRKHKIKPHPSFIIGSPHETAEQIEETIRFIKDNDIQEFEPFVLTPFPGTPVWDYAKARGLVSDDMDWSRLDQRFGPQSIHLSDLPRQQLEYFYHILMNRRRYYAITKGISQGIRRPWRIPAYVFK